MSKEKSIEILKVIQTMDDIEVSHIKADKVLCDLLTELGCEEVVKEYQKIHKWYA